MRRIFEAAYPFFFAVFLFQTQPLSTVAGCAGFCGEDYACLLVFDKNSLDGGGLVVYFILAVFKHPADVLFNKEAGYS